MKKMFLKELVKLNGDEIVYFKNCKKDKKYMSVFNYCEKNEIKTYDSFEYYNDYVIELNKESEEK